MTTSLVMSHNYAYVANPGGVADVAENLAVALRRTLPNLEEVFPSPKHQRARTLRRFSEEIALELRYFRKRVVLFFPNYFSVPLPGSATLDVVVIHDLQYRAYPQFHSLPKRLLLEASHRIARWRAAGVVFISESTKTDFIHHFGPPRRHCVILNPVAIDTCPVEPALAETIGRSPYAIANFHSYPHKNIEKVFTFFKQLRKIRSDLKLVITGRQTEIEQTIRKCGLAAESVILTGFIPKPMVVQLVANAEFFISLSLFEGFNMAAAEAAKLGRPLLLSDIPAHRELFGGYAHLIEPHANELPLDAFSKYLSSFTAAKKWKYFEDTEPAATAAKYARFFDELQQS